MEYYLKYLLNSNIEEINRVILNYTFEEIDNILFEIQSLKSTKEKNYQYELRTIDVSTENYLKKIKERNIKIFKKELKKLSKIEFMLLDRKQVLYDEIKQVLYDEEYVQEPLTLEQLEAELFNIRAEIEKKREENKWYAIRLYENKNENQLNFINFVVDNMKKIELEIEELLKEEVRLLSMKTKIVSLDQKPITRREIQTIEETIVPSKKGYTLIDDIKKYKNNLDLTNKEFEELEKKGLFQINCINGNLPSDLSKRPFFLFYGKPSFMINYHYVWKSRSREEDKNILKIILKYSYPSCLMFEDLLTDDDKKEIINNEFIFIKNKIEKFTDTVIQIPRIIYDLYNIIFRRNNYENMQSFKCNVDSTKFIEFITNIKINTDQQLENIIDMNKIFFTLLLSYNDLFKPIISTDVYLKIFDDLYKIIVFNSKPQPQEMDPNPRSPTLYSLTNIENFNNIFNKRFKTILFQTLLLELGFIYDITTDKYNLNTRNDIVVLYRGFSGNIFSTLKKDEPHSNSFNTSILNGMINDVTATTYLYMKPGCYKHFYLIKKHFYKDQSDESKLFFIPPIHPFLLLYCIGEYWHARSKIFPKDYSTTNYLSGIATRVSDFIVSSLDKDKLEKTFISIIKPLTNELVDKYYKKYLKYKNKYLKLKSVYINT